MSLDQRAENPRKQEKLVQIKEGKRQSQRKKNQNSSRMLWMAGYSRHRLFHSPSKSPTLTTKVPGTGLAGTYSPEEGSLTSKPPTIS